MSIDPTKVPTTAEIYASKDAMDDIQSFTYSGQDSFVDAKGTIRDTVVGQIKKMGYEVPVTYVASIVFAADDNTKTIDKDGVIYAPLPSSLPFTTSGTWGGGGDEGKFFVIQVPGMLDAIEAEELARIAGDEAEALARTAGDVRAQKSAKVWEVPLSNHLVLMIDVDYPDGGSFEVEISSPSSTFIGAVLYKVKPGVTIDTDIGDLSITIGDYTDDWNSGGTVASVNAGDVFRLHCSDGTFSEFGVVSLTFTPN